MRRLTVLALALALTACSGGGGSNVSQAFCNDLDDGMTMFNLMPSGADPEEFANDAWGYVQTTCPEHYEPNRAYFDQWGLPEI